MFARCKSILGLMLVCAAGCMTLSAKRESRMPGPPEFAGKVYLVRGVSGVTSLGVNAMAKQLTAIGVANEAVFYSQSRFLAGRIAKERQESPGPLVLVGHSYGADAAVSLAHSLEARGVTVDLLVTFDPVTPSRIPKNVARAFNIYRDQGAWDKVPIWRGVPLQAEPDSHIQLTNLNVREHPDLNFANITHGNIDDNSIIQQEALRQILRTCKMNEIVPATASNRK
jgi:Thioesterase domain